MRYLLERDIGDLERHIGDLEFCLDHDIARGRGHQRGRTCR